jgi:hypothetical protein
MVAKTTSGSDNPTSPKMAATTYLPTTTSWSAQYGREKMRSYRSKYGKLASYESASKIYKDRQEFDLETRRADSRKSRYYDGAEMTRVTSGGRTRVARSEDRDVNYEITRSNRLLQSSRQYDYQTRSYITEDDKENKPIKRYGQLPSHRIGRSASVDRDATLQIDHDLRRDRKKSRFLDTYSTAAIKRKVEEVYDRKQAAETYDYEPRRTRSQSVTRSSPYQGFDFRTMLDGVRRVPRATSLSRFEDSEIDIDKIINHPKRSSSVSRSLEPEWDMSPKKTHMSRRGEQSMELQIQDFQSNRHGSDLSSHVLDPNTRFEPDNVQVIELPSGKRAVTMTKFNQSGSGDQREANSALNRVVEKTRYMQQGMSSLEDFVRRNRSMFPEDTRIYQRVRYFQLNEQQLLEIGECPDAEVFGVKIAEKLVVPPGTDVGHLLNKYYGKKDVEVEYDERESRRRDTEERMETDYQKMQDDIRLTVEKEYETREKKRILGDESFEVKQASAQRKYHEHYGHIHPHLTPNYIQSIYRDAGAHFDDIYQQKRRPDGSKITADRDPSRSDLASRGRRLHDNGPVFSSVLRPKTCHIGQTVRLNCSVSGVPMPSITWLHGTRILNDGGKYDISNNYGLLSLEIRDVKREDAGLYTVKAVSKEGEISCSGPLDILEWDKKEEDRVSSSKPVFTVEASNAWAERGSKAIIEATAVGKPMPMFKWLKDNILITETDRIHVISDESGHTKLVVRNIQPSDAGLYFCVAENKGGKAKCAATLRFVETPIDLDAKRARPHDHVSEVPKLDLGPSIPDGNRPWFIQKPPTEMRIREGEPLTIRCIIDGDPKPLVTWYKGVREMTYTQRHRIMVEGANHYMFQITSTVQTDPGQYIVVAENSSGKTQASIYVSILARDAIDDEDWHLHRSKLELPTPDWEVDAKSSQGRTPPKFIKKLPLETEVSPGHDLEIKCQVTEEEPTITTSTDVKMTMSGEAKLSEEVVTISTQSDAAQSEPQIEESEAETAE